MMPPTPTAAPVPRPTFQLDDHQVPFTPGQTVIQAALAAGIYIPHLCHHPDFAPHGSCKVCTCRINGRMATSCTFPAAEGLQVESEAPEVQALRRDLVQFLFTEGNHFCPSCEQSGDCKLQAVAYDLGLLTGHYNPLFPDRPVDASHSDVLLDTNRCILCELCVRASATMDGKSIFALSGRGITKHLVVNAESGRLGDTILAVTDKAMSVCPVGALIRKRQGFRVPIGQRTYDAAPIREIAVQGAATAPGTGGQTP
ncbi:2Fe-2S iron-sulfur cluster-binding protein [Myxococcota bacterium]|nr:2Fe-2S iron-sulfur cluster-binding protein [Myxococcota bacterium]